MRINSGSDINGGRYGELTYVRTVGVKVYPSGQKAQLWELSCSCGKSCVAPDRQVRSGLKQSCGHLKYAPRVKTHGGARGKNGTPEWRTWRAMRNRCTNPNDTFYSRYGGRGIKVCDRWLHSFEHFLSDMGRKPTPQHTIERIKVDGDYEPGNCRWATLVEQANNKSTNRRIEWQGESRTIAEWARTLGINYYTLHSRLTKLGWSFEDAIRK